jgi:hypothetical protein
LLTQVFLNSTFPKATVVDYKNKTNSKGLTAAIEGGAKGAFEGEPLFEVL